MTRSTVAARPPARQAEAALEAAVRAAVPGTVQTDITLPSAAIQRARGRQELRAAADLKQLEAEYPTLLACPNPEPPARLPGLAAADPVGYGGVGGIDGGLPAVAVPGADGQVRVPGRVRRPVAAGAVGASP
ncbi:MAG: hypothetical protein ABIL09_18015 [Gemmatimonadota bacterium]